MTLFKKPNLELDFRSYIVHQHKRQYVHRQFHLLSLRLYAPWCTKVNRRRVEMITGWIRSARINGGAIRPDNGQGALYNASQNGSLYAPLLESLVYSSSYSSSLFSLSDYRLRRGQGQCEEQIRAEWAYFYFAVRWAIDWGFAFEALRTSSAKTICTKGRYKRPRWTRANQVGTNGTARAPMGLVSGVCHVCQDDRNMHERYYIVGLVYSLRLTAEWF
jgi:hypothetical protein